MEKIRSVIKGFRKSLPAELSALLQQGAGEISALDITENALRPGDAAPEFELAAYGGGRRTLAGYLNSGPLVLTFYRGVWCPCCNLQLKEYDDRLREVTNLGATLAAVTPEQPGTLDQLKVSRAPADVVAGAITSVGFDVLHDGEVLQRGKLNAVLAGAADHVVAAIIRFPNQESPAAWHASPECQAIIPLRDEAADITSIAYDALT